MTESVAKTASRPKPKPKPKLKGCDKPCPTCTPKSPCLPHCWICNG